MQAVMVILGKSQEWGEIRKTIADKAFLKMLKDQVKCEEGVWSVPSEAVIKKVEKFTRQDFFKPEIMMKKSLIAAKMAAWVCAIENYAKIQREIEPKKAKLADAERKLDTCRKKVEETNKMLKEGEETLEFINQG